MLQNRKTSKPWLLCIIGICLKSCKNMAAGWMIQWHSVFRNTQTYATRDLAQVWPHGSRSTSRERQHLAGMKLVTWRRGLNSLELALTTHRIQYWERTPPHTGKYSNKGARHLKMAKYFRLYHERYADKFNGKVGIALNCDWAQPASESAEDKAAADRFLQWYIGIWAHPILHGKKWINFCGLEWTTLAASRIHLSGATLAYFKLTH